MNPVTQIKARIKKTAQQLTAAKRREAKADASTRKASRDLIAARENVKTIETEQARLAQILKLEEGGLATKGPKGKVQKPAKVAAASVPAKKSGPKPKAKAVKAVKATKAVKAAVQAENQSRAAQGRREVARGDRKPIKEVIAKVLGKRVMNAQGVFEAIKAKGALPNSGDPRGYIGYLLSASKVTITRGGKEFEVPLFDRVHEKGRGFYKNRGVAVPVGKAAEPKAAPKAAKAKDKSTAKAPPPMKDGKRTVTCKICLQPGHNSLGHAKHVKAAKAEAPKAAKVKAAPKVKVTKTVKAVAPKAEAHAGKKKSTCTVCQKEGHNKRGHDKFVAAQAAAKTNGKSNGVHPGTPVKAAPVKAAPVKAAKAAPAPTEKGPNKCKVCQTPGHNAKGHAKWAEKQAAGKTNGTTHVAKPEPKSEAEETIETKADKPSSEELSTDELLKEAGIEVPVPAPANP